MVGIAPTETTFTPPWWLRNTHLQTVWGRVARSRRLVNFRRETLTTPDGDDLVLDHVEPLNARADARVILLHGLEGSSFSVYMQGLASLLAAEGVPSTAMNFRFCARKPAHIFECIPNRGARLYHSGETTDLDFVIRTLTERHPGIVLGAIGTSLGGNVLLKWLGEHAGEGRLRAAATMSVPYDLGAGARFLDQSAIGRFYVSGFVKSLSAKAAHVVRNHPELSSRVDPIAARRSRNFIEFDDAATAPMHGFAGSADYYERCSSIRFVSRIDVPTLCISADDDPFLPRSVLGEVRSVKSPAVELLTTPFGGHAGFVSGPRPWRCHYWGEQIAVDAVLAHLRA